MPSSLLILGGHCLKPVPVATLISLLCQAVEFWGISELWAMLAKAMVDLDALSPALQA